MRLRDVALAAVVAFALAGAAAAQDRPVVATASGPVRGVVEGGASVFKGIPFAASTAGARRWTPPVPPAPWTAPRDASDYGPICPQPARPDGQLAAGAGRPQSEDCLYLNVWAPKAAKNAPVMVWIHGGAHRVGSGEGPIYEGGAFVHDGVVLVTLNYRLGGLGYFAHPALTKAAGPDEPLGDYGMMDQMAALAWVKQNIAAFGGDPKNVTVFGESAGGQSILALLSTPKAKGLFDKAIVESGGGWQASRGLAAEERKGVVLATAAGLPGADATLEQLRAMPVNKLIEMKGGAGGVGPFPDGRLLKRGARQAFASGTALDVPLIIGSNSFEASLMKNFPVPIPQLLARFTPEQKAAYGALGSEQATAEAAYTDMVMGGPARWIAGKASTGAPAYLYHFSYVATAQRGKVPGASHGSEIVYVFGNGDKVPGRRLTSSQDKDMEALMHACWVAFAKTGKPTCGSGAAWPAYDPAADQLMEFGVDPGVRTNFRKAFLDADQKAAGL
jgi:para-nitrobenzyl esterase